jgi:hypothetical protein
VFIVVAADAQSQSAGNEPINTIKNYQTAWNSGDAIGVADCLHKDAKILTSKKGNYCVTKEKYVKTYLPHRIINYPHVTFSAHKIAKFNNHVVVKAVANYKGLLKKVGLQFKMIEENGQWYIVEQKYYIKITLNENA